MKTTAFLSALAAILLAAMPAQAAVFTGVFSGGAESPPNGSAGTGTVTVTVDEALQTMLVEMSFSGLTGSTTVAHLHCCAGPGVNASVAVQGPTLMGFPAGVTSGSYSHTFDLTEASTYLPNFLTSAGGNTAAASQLLIASLFSGLVYANIHTTGFPGGEIRADLSEVPLPAALWLFLAGAAAFWRAARARHAPAA